MQQEVELESDLGQNRPWRVRAETYIQGSRLGNGSSFIIRASLALTIWAVVLSSHCVGAQVEHYWKVVPRFWKDESATYILVGNIVAIIVGITLPVLLGMLIFYACRRIHMHANPQEVAGPRPVVVGRVAARRLDQHAIELFPLLSFPGDGTVGFGESSCQICYEEFVHGEGVRVLPACNHIFHHECITKWLTSSSTECPICRHEYLGV